MKRIYAIEKWCIDCKRCEIACRSYHSRTKDPVLSWRLENNEPKNRVRVEGNLHLSLPINCRHCKHPLCVEGCISGAMQKDPVTGVVTSDPNRCVGCRTCVSMCPYGCVRVEEIGGRELAVKCDLCGEELGQVGKPNCVAACPNRALIFVESEVG